MEKILSLHIGHDATAMFIDEKDLISVSEERISRIKSFYGLPNKAISKIFTSQLLKLSIHCQEFNIMKC